MHSPPSPCRQLFLVLFVLAAHRSSLGRAEDPAPAVRLAPDREQQVSPLYESSPLVALANGETRATPYLLDEFATDGMYGDEFGVHVLPQGLIYRSYLAGPKEPRMSAEILRVPSDSWLWQATVGARVGLLRIGNGDSIRPRGFQIDAEGAGMVRLDLQEEVDVRSADFRGGVPLTWGNERRQWKLAYYHLSSHLGDEFLFKNDGFPVFAQARDVFVLGYSYYLTDALRLYGEAGWAFYCAASEPWEFQFGLDFAPRGPTGLHGAPFLAINGHLREELDFGGGLCVQLGWAWRSDMTAHLLRMGLQYYNGASTQYAFLPFHEQQIGFGIWYDF